MPDYQEDSLLSALQRRVEGRAIVAYCGCESRNIVLSFSQQATVLVQRLMRQRSRLVDDHVAARGRQRIALRKSSNPV